jgi:hypothetical protein
MTGFTATSITTGGAFVAIGLFGLFAPDRAAAALRRFPRSKWPAWGLCAIDLLWSGWLLYHTELGRFSAVKPYLYALVPLAFVLVVNYMDELLAPRALGGLFILLPAPMLSAVRWYDSPLRYPVVLIAYAMVIAGIVLVLSPYRFRRTVAPCVENPRGCRVWGACGAAIGTALIIVALAAR